MKKVKKIPNCCSYNSPGFTYSQPFQTDAQMVLDLKLSYEHPPKQPRFLPEKFPYGSNMGQKRFLDDSRVKGNPQKRRC